MMAGQRSNAEGWGGAWKCTFASGALWSSQFLTLFNTKGILASIRSVEEYPRFQVAREGWHDGSDDEPHQALMLGSHPANATEILS